MRIHYFHSFCGFKEAVTFKTIDQQDIEHIESRMKSKLQNHLDESKNQDDFTNINYVDFFGEEYINSPGDFTFTRGDQKLIKELVDHVKRVVDQNNELNSGIQHFSSSVSSQKQKRLLYRGTKYYKQFYGRYFTKNETNSVIDDGVKPKLRENSNTNLMQSKLFDEVQKYISSHLLKENFPAFEQNHTSLEIEDNGKITGVIACVACEAEKGVKKPIRVSMKQMVGSDDGTWVISNFSTHVKRCHSDFLKEDCKTEKRTRKPKVKQNPKARSNNKSNKRQQETRVPLKGSTNHNAGNKRIKKEPTVSDSKSVELMIEPMIDSNGNHETAEDFETSIYNQISNQILKMIESSMKHNVNRYEMKFNIESNTSTLLVEMIYGDGHCLFRAIAHQLFRGILGTDEQDKATLKLRSDVVSYIKEHYSEFVWELRGAVYDKFDVVPRGEMDDKCRDYLNEYLANCGWGGSETLKAVSEMYQVNILVLNEGDSGYFVNSFNTSFNQTILLAYKVLKVLTVEQTMDETIIDDTFKNDEEWESIIDESTEDDCEHLETPAPNHYDSVVHIEQNVILDLSKSLATVEFKKLDEISHISLE